MIPALFPFTCLSGSMMKNLAAHFDQIIVYLPHISAMPASMQEWVEKGHLLPRAPADINADQLLQTVKEYLHWVDVHQGADRIHFKTTGNKIPFFDETSLSCIRDDIRKKQAAQTGLTDDLAGNSAGDLASDQASDQIGDPEHDPIFQAGLFLQIARDFDMQDLEINTSLASVAEIETNLMKNLQGEEFLFPFKGSALKTLYPDDPGRYMTAGRLDAWASLMQSDDELPELFITTSPAVMEHVLDLAPDATPVEELEDYLTFPFPVYQIADIHPALFFSRFIKKQNINSLKSRNFKCLHEHTLIGLIDETG